MMIKSTNQAIARYNKTITPQSLNEHDKRKHLLIANYQENAIVFIIQ